LASNFDPVFNEAAALEGDEDTCSDFVLDAAVAAEAAV